MKTLKYILWAALSITLVLLVSVNARPPKHRLTQSDIEFDERAIC